MGIQCKDMPCKPCQEARFDIKDANSKDIVATMIKKSSGCCKAMCTDVDYFSLIFPPQCLPEHKGLLLMATLLIDY